VRRPFFFATLAAGAGGAGPPRTYTRRHFCASGSGSGAVRRGSGPIGTVARRPRGLCARPRPAPAPTRGVGSVPTHHVIRESPQLVQLGASEHVTSSENRPNPGSWGGGALLPALPSRPVRCAGRAQPWQSCAIARNSESYVGRDSWSCARPFAPPRRRDQSAEGIIPFEEILISPNCALGGRPGGPPAGISTLSIVERT
jgi:hypothetical protein